MKKLFNLESTFKATTTEDGNIRIRGMASTSDIDRAGDVVLTEAWGKGGLENFKRNPIILFNHDYDEPIGKATEINVLDKGLEIVVEISKAAGKAYGLVKDGVLSTFSIGFRIKDADYIQETGGLLIKDVELYEVSVVSVPCNQAATFSIAKSFATDSEYRQFVEQFKSNSVNLAGQSLATGEENSSDIASTTPEGADPARMESKMTKEEMDKLIAKIGEEAAAKVKADIEAERVKAEEAEAAIAAEKAKKLQEEEVVKTAVAVAMQTGAEKLVEDMKAAMSAKDADMAEVLKSFKDDLKAHTDEITAMRESKRTFADRNNGKKDLSAFAQDFLAAKMLGVITEKGYNTSFAAEVAQKAGVDYATSAADIDQTVSTTIEQEIRLNLRAANLFRELPVISGATVLPIQTESELATWQKIGAPAGNLENRGDADNTFKTKQVILNAYRLISSTYIDNDTDEQILVNLMPMMIDAVAHAHARSVDHMIVNGTAAINGLNNNAVASGQTLSIGSGAKLTADALMAARSKMGKYGIMPNQVAYLVSMAGYYDLINDPDFQNMDEVGTMATKVTGMVGSVFGSPVVVSDNFPAIVATATAAFAVNTRNFVIPRLRGVNLESDYEVANQRRIIVASQSLGFEQLIDGAGVNEPVTKVSYVA